MQKAQSVADISKGNDTAANWARAATDLDGALTGSGQNALLLQAIVFGKNGTGSGNPNGLLNVTGDGVEGAIALPYFDDNGTQVMLGDEGLGYPSILYPNLTFTSTVVNSTYNDSNAFFDGKPLYSNSTLVLGPWSTNESFSLLSLTVSINNNTSRTDILGWLTVVINARMLYNIVESPEGLDSTGEILLVGPATSDNLYDIPLDTTDLSTLAKTEVMFVLPPQNNATLGNRHLTRAYNSSGGPELPFTMQSYPAVIDAYTKNNHAVNNAGAMISSKNEEGKTVSVGYAIPSSDMVDWVLIFEESHGEVHAPIDHLRNVLLACKFFSRIFLWVNLPINLAIGVFGTTGLILLLMFPIAHYSVLPIRRLREATRKTVEPYVPPSLSGSQLSFENSRNGDNSNGSYVDDVGTAEEARKEGYVGNLTHWRTNRRKARAERKEAARRQTFRIPGKVQDKKHVVHDELTDLTTTFNEMSEELVMQYERLEERVKQRTAELELSKKAAEAANESKTLFIANISHELKTPLNGILGMCAVCMQEEDQSKIRRSLQIIYKSGDLLLHLLTDLLTFSKNEIGQQLSLDEKEFRLADICSQVLSIFDKQARDGHIKFNVEFSGPHDSLGNSSEIADEKIYGPFGTGRVKDMCLWGDQHRILQVLINLVSNSLKFTPSGGSVEVRIKCLGEEETPPMSKAGSRKGSFTSKQSRQSRQHSNTSQKDRRKGHSSQGQNSRGRGSESSITPLPQDANGGLNPDNTLTINVMGRSKELPQIAVRTRSVSPPPMNSRNLAFIFEVEDTGPGIPETQQQRVFEPFVQGDLGLSKKYGGTGLGLSICAQLAGLMGGSISLKSMVGVGSTFSMRIPLRFIKDRADSTASSHAGPGSRPGSMLGQSVYDDPRTPNRAGSSSDLSLKSTASNPNPTGFDTPAKPRLVGLSQPFFATSPPPETPDQKLAAVERVAKEAAKKGQKVRVLVAEDNKVNQEVVLRMLKLEDIYGELNRSAMHPRRQQPI